MKDLKDRAYLEMAYTLAEKAKGWASPNPYVGAVIVKNNIIVGHGYHEKPGQPHAEVVALQKTGPLSRNSTVYVTLEPCVHWGRTPPCVEALLEARPKRVVISALDPNPMVFKKGVKRMREAGIDVSYGLLAERNRRLNEIYIKYITTQIPFVAAKAAVSLDGKISTKTYSSQWISSSGMREYVHLIRGEYDAVMIGINTLLKDDPRLTVRHPNWRGKKLTRVILDSRLRFPLRAKILETLGTDPVLVITLDSSSARKAKALQKRGVGVVSLPGSKLSLKKALQALGKKGIPSVLVEGGGSLLTSFIEQRLVDKIFATISPKLIGGSRAPTFLDGKGVRLIQDAQRLKETRVFQIDDEILFEGYF